TFILEVRTTHRDPEVAALIADRYVDCYIHFVQRRGATGNEAAIAFLSKQARDLEQRVSDAERELQEYRQKHNLISVQDNKDLIAQRLNEINSRLTAARMERIDLEERIRQVRDLKDNDGNLLELEVASLRSTPEVMTQLNALRQ